MTVLFFRLSKNSKAMQWQKAVHDLPIGQEIRDLCSLEEFNLLIPSTRRNKDIVIVYVQSQNELAKLRNLNRPMNDIFMIVICNSKKPELFAKCRHIYPRLLVRDNESIDVISAIIKKRLTQ